MKKYVTLAGALIVLLVSFSVTFSLVNPDFLSFIQSFQLASVNNSQT